MHYPRPLACLLLVFGMNLSGVTDLAAQLDNRELQTGRGPALVYVEGRGNPDDKRGYGVLISRAGHVLTAKHILGSSGQDPVVGRLGSRSVQPQRLSVVAHLPGSMAVQPGQIDKEALTLLKFDGLPSGDLTPAPVAAVREYDVNDVVRIITGTLQEPEPSLVHAAPASRSGGGRWQLSGHIDAGTSGSPAYDRAGNLIGIVTEGVPGVGQFIVRTNSAFRRLLSENQVVMLPESTLPDLVAIYATTKSNALSELNTFATFYASQTNTAFFDLAKTWLKKELEVMSIDWDRTSAFERIAEKASDTQANRKQKTDDIERLFTRAEVFGILKTLAGGFKDLYLTIFQLGVGPNGTYMLVVIHNQGFEDSEGRQFKVKDIKQAPTRIPAPDLVQITNLAAGLLLGLIAVQPEFGRNGHLLTNCIRLLAGDDRRRAIALIGPQLIASKLKDRWNGDSELKNLKVNYMRDTTCDKQIGSDNPNYEPGQRLSQFRLETFIYQLSDKIKLKWELKHAGIDDKEFVAHLPDDVDEEHLGSPEKFDDVAMHVANAVTMNWRNAVDVFKLESNN